MRTEVLTGSKDEIAKTFTRISGEIRQVIVFVEDAPAPLPSQPEADIFAEMEPLTVKSGGADYSRQSLYTPLENE